MFTTPFSEFNFGQYDARREYDKNAEYFLDTFISPISLSIESLSNRGKFIIIGRKGSGKTAALIKKSVDAARNGYITHIISFYDDITPDETKSLSKAQHFSFLDFSKVESVLDFYDFREIWKRILLISIARSLYNKGIDNLFTSFVLSTTKDTNSFVSGLIKGLKVSVDVPIGIAKVCAEWSGNSGQTVEVDLKRFNDAALEVASSELLAVKFLGIIDELVISHLNNKSDEYTLKVALIRDLLKAAAKLNDRFCRDKLDIHFVCNLRPEVRHHLTSVDAEISKIIDDSDAPLNWYSAGDENPVLLNLFRNKVAYGAPFTLNIDDVDKMLPKTISFGDKKMTFAQFIAINTWHRPRDIVRLLNCYSKIHPEHTVFSEDGWKNSLNEYGRVSANEIFDELSVYFEKTVLEAVRSAIRRKRYENQASLVETLSEKMSVDSAHLACNALFETGAIGNLDYVNGKPRFFWAQRGEDRLDSDMKIEVHKGLWNYFNIRHR